PCTRNARSLLVCAVARECLGEHGKALELERTAEEIGVPWKQNVDTPRLRLALLRGDRSGAQALLERQLEERGPYLSGTASTIATAMTQLDALAELGMRDLAEEHASRFLVPGAYVEPFALRALGRVRGERELIERAHLRFEALGLAWHANQTSALL